MSKRTTKKKFKWCKHIYSTNDGLDCWLHSYTKFKEDDSYIYSHWVMCPICGKKRT